MTAPDISLFDEYVLTIILGLPVLGVVLIAAIPGYRRELIKWMAALISLTTLAFTVYVFLAYDRGDDAGRFQFLQQYGWLDSLGVTLQLGVDGIAVPMLVLTGVVMLAASLVSWNIENRTKDFFILFMLLVTGVLGVFVSLDLFFFFFFYELAVLPMYLLIGVWGSSTDFGTFYRGKEYGAMKLVIYLVAGSVLVWIAILAIFTEAGVGSFNLLDLDGTEFSTNFQRLFFPFLMVGFGILAGLWPFHTWSPDGHVAAPTAVSMLHAGVLMKLGAFGIIRVGLELMPDGTRDWMPLLVTLGTINVLYGAVSALGQRDLKYVVGYSSVSHMGYVLIGIATLDRLGFGGAVLQMFSHGIMTALFFAMVGIIYDRTHIRDITVLEGLSKRMGVTTAFFAVAGLTSLGLPGLSGFVAELLVFLGAFRTYPVLGVLAVIGAAITAVYILRLLAKVFFGPISERWQQLADASRLEGVAGAFLVLVLVLVGIMPFPFMRIIDSGVVPLLEKLAVL